MNKSPVHCKYCKEFLGFESVDPKQTTGVCIDCYTAEKEGLKKENNQELQNFVAYLNTAKSFIERAIKLLEKEK